MEGESKKSLDAFKAKFKDKYKVDVQIYAPYVYDAVNVMVDAMVKAKSADPKVYLPVLAKTSDFKGVTGTIAFDAKGDIKNGALTLYTYKGGNPWILTTLWLGMIELSLKNKKQARDCFQWVVSKATAQGLLAEQVHRETGQPCWVIPLAWSHAMFLLFVREVLDRHAEAEIWDG